MKQFVLRLSQIIVFTSIWTLQECTEIVLCVDGNKNKLMHL